MPNYKDFDLDLQNNKNTNKSQLDKMMEQAKKKPRTAGPRSCANTACNM